MKNKPNDIRFAWIAVGIGVAAIVLYWVAHDGPIGNPPVEPETGQGSVERDATPTGNGDSTPQGHSAETFQGVLAAESGLAFQMRFLPGEQGANFKINLYDHGCGVVVGDYDGDGHDDIYFLNQLGKNGLFRNRGNGTFEDVTERMGVAVGDRICVGAVFADYDNDGDQDLFVTSTRGGNLLFRNENRERFVDVTREAGVAQVGHAQTPVFFDYDRDGQLDLLVVQTAEWTTDELGEGERYFVGKGGAGGFGEVVTARRERNLLYHNEGNGKFREVAEEAGIGGRGWAGDAAVFDYDEDGWLDVLVTSMFGRAQLYRNLGTGRFEDVTLATLGKTPFGAIGAKPFDYNNDGRLDLYIVDMHSDMWMGLDYQQQSLPLARRFEQKRFPTRLGPLPPDDVNALSDEEFETILDFRHAEVVFGNAFYRNAGGGKFEELSEGAGLENFWPWGIAPGDFDNDGDHDLFVTTGMGFPFYYWGNYLLENEGRGKFRNRAREWGIEPPPGGEFTGETIRETRCVRSSRCVATADFDHDGRLEVVTNNFNDAPYYFRNRLPQRDFVAFRLRGVRSNRDAIGAVVRLRVGERTMTRQLESSGGYLSQSSKQLHFGLGDWEWNGDVEIRWPTGATQVVRGVKRNAVTEVVEEADSSAPSEAVK